ncbi:hypothetical protein AAHA92_33282 [Salvia divinorum]|uniref:HAT C-terminal dimerisation domain-containing protein n=1 Tax=Salvia divinorum TaxID=28513 RepID=A0ABD1FR49_SALDI
MAKEIFSVPASTVAVESAFSVGACVLDERRSTSLSSPKSHRRCSAAAAKVATQQESPLFCRRRGRAAVTGPAVAVRPLPLLRSRDPPPRSDSPAGFPLDPQYRERKT